ncbi:MAG: hemerythrin domain-containing protein [Epsilonproteobacteria bacterium]|nr:hemerythrin domain-containing protein [Campylobacterota bacterium]
MEISNYLVKEHRECDDIFAKAEEAAAKGDFKKAKEEFLKFADETLHHFKKEEEELFPEFENMTGSSDGPTMVMRYEHDQVRGLMGKMAQAIEAEDKDAYLSLAESMMILLQQHNMKEEQMLYAMCDRVFDAAKKEEVISKMEKVEP